MTISQCIGKIIQRFAEAKRGNVLLMTGLMATVLVTSVGVAVDYGRMVHFRNTLQGVVDAAAIAGATAYSTAGDSSTAQTIAQHYVNSASLPSYSGSLSVSATPSSTSSGYFMTVSARASMQTTFLALWTSSVSIYASAQAENAIFNIQISAAGWNANAYDQNTVYYYLFDPSNNVIPDSSDLHPLFSNAPGFNNPTTVNLQVAATQQIAFAFKNITGGNHSYSQNGYSGTQGSTHWFYSPYPENPDTANNYTTPNAVAYPNTVAHAGNGGQTYTPPSNCSLEITTGTSTETSSTTTPPTSPVNAFNSASTGSCNDSTANSNYNDTKKYSAPSCSSLNTTTTKTTTKNGKKTTTTTYTYTYAQFNWNDMGGGTDDYDYNDGVYYISCPSPNGVANLVTLTQ